MGKRYELTEACDWFVDGAAEYYGFDVGEVDVTQSIRDAWDAWINVCDDVWRTALHTRCHESGASDGPDMPEAFPVDYMHTHQGAGVGFDDGCRAYALTEDECEQIARVGGDCYTTGEGPLGQRVAAAFRAFEDAVNGAVDVARTERAAELIAPFCADLAAAESAADARAASLALLWALETPEETRTGRILDTELSTWDLVEDLDLVALADEELARQSEAANERGYLAHWR